MNDRPRGPKGPLPARWLKCPRKGGIVASRFVPFKTPLDHNFNELIPNAYRFPPSQLINSVQSQVDSKTGQKYKIGLWIDLTNTDRFYDPQSEVESKGIKYIKLKCLGRQETPTTEQTAKFIHQCKLFINQKPTELIAVHCTHGFNRTGFLISAFLVEVDDWSVQMAIQTFEAQRSPGIYKHDYLEELIKRYDDGEPVPQAPPLPEWCFEDEEDDDLTSGDRHNRTSNSDGDGSSNQEKGDNYQDNVQHNPVFMEGVDGVVAVTNVAQRRKLIDIVRKMTEWRGKDPFPGAQPVSMTLKNLDFFRQIDYKVSWKADGTRYMMLIKDRDEIYFFDRKSDFFQVQNVTFPRRGRPNDVLTDTLLDGEMVIDQDHGNKVARYLIYDIVSFPGSQVAKCDFDTRMKCIKNEIIFPRHEALKCGTINRSNESFGIRVKDFWEIIGTKKLLSPEFTKSVGHEIDGLIFQPVPLPYESGTNETILKWKPHTLNSIDFRIKIVTKEDVGCIRQRVVQYWVVGGPIARPFFEIAINSIRNPETKADIRNYDNQLVECVWEGGKPPIGWFKVIRTRTDKPNPNSWNTAEKVMGSIINPVTKEHLLKVIDHVVGHRNQAAAAAGKVVNASPSVSSSPSISGSPVFSPSSTVSSPSPLKMEMKMDRAMMPPPGKKMKASPSD